MYMNSIITIAKYVEIKDQNDLVLIEVFSGEKKEKPLQNAIGIHLETELSDIKQDLSLGGRHPLPSVSNFAKVLEKHGIQPQHHLIIYDRNHAAMGAARLWWMLKAIGHKKVQVLNGGYQAAIEFGLATEGDNHQLKLVKSNYPIQNWQLATISKVELQEKIKQQSICLVDVRSSERFLGITEPIDLIAGHIPTAINLPFNDHLENGDFLSPEQFKEKYSYLDKEKVVVVYCGSGVSACHLHLAMDSAGLKIPTLYVGSWSEWSRDKDTEKTTRNV